MNDENRDVWLAGAMLRRPRHVCAFFHSREEESQVILPFIKEGLERGDKVFDIVDPEFRRERLQSLAEADVPVADFEDRGQLEVCGWDNVYLRNGHFDQNAMLHRMEEVLLAGAEKGFPLTRVIGSVEWAQEDRPLLNDVVEYETRLNDLLANYEDAIICTYDCSKFGADIAIDVLRTHPLVIIGGILHENPFFVPPDEFLRELHSRANRAPSA